MLSIIIPVYNRLDNLKLCVAAIENQKGVNEDFEVIVVDDGSFDGVDKWVDEKSYAHETYLNSAIHWPLRYLSGGPNKGFRGGRARNIGAFNSKGTRFLFIDSDVVLNEYALKNYLEAAHTSPDAVIVGRYFFLPKIWYGDHPEILWQSENYAQLLEKINQYQLAMDENAGPRPIQYGLDLGARPEEDFTKNPLETKRGSGLGALSGNVSYPKELFYACGGFEEMMVGHGGEDACLGLQADQYNADWLFYRPIVGFHIWHERDQQRNAREVQANIAYIDARFGIGQYANAKKWSESRDFTDQIHYHKHVGAIAMKLKFDHTVFAARTDLMTRIGITTPMALMKLGFESTDIMVVPEETLDQYKVVGNTRDD